MEQIINSHPDVLAYKVLVHDFLWGACLKTYLTVIGSLASVKLLRAMWRSLSV